jgi:hypothetical protein
VAATSRDPCSCSFIQVRGSGILRNSNSVLCINVPLGIASRWLSALRRQVGDHKMSGSRISMRLPGWHQVHSTRSKRTSRAPSSPTTALKMRSGNLVF